MVGEIKVDDWIEFDVLDGKQTGQVTSIGSSEYRVTIPVENDTIIVSVAKGPEVKKIEPPK